MNDFVLSGANATISLTHAGVTIKHALTRREKTIAWSDVGGVHLEPGNWLTRPKLFVITKREAQFAGSNFSLLRGAAGKEAAQWFVVVPLGQDERFAALKDEIIRRVVHAKTNAGAIEASAFQPGDGVLVAWSDGQRYAASLRAVEGAQLLVAFPNGSEHWVAREHVSRA
jgi:hypothetical protein